ncbi:MAG: hypothetical protein HUJ51_04780 [Eggerthellaceae bacterium]|nr:hypothetical protein [Eggerthellaceae bacterium]
MKQGSVTYIMSGVAVGPVCVIKTVDISNTASSCDSEKEMNLLSSCIYLSKEKISKLAQSMREKFGGELAQILEIQILMLEDQDYIDAIYAKIGVGMGAVGATKKTVE